MNDKPLNVEQTKEYVDELIGELTDWAVLKERSKEMTAAIITAMSDVMAIIAVRTMGSEQALEVVSMAMARSMKIAIGLDASENKSVEHN